MSIYEYKEVVSAFAWDSTNNKIALVEKIGWRGVNDAMDRGLLNVYDVGIDVVPNPNWEGSKLVTVNVYYRDNDINDGS